MHKIALLLFLLSVPYHLPAATFHALLAIDTTTHDVKQTTATDLKKINHAIDEITDSTGLHLNRKIFKGPKLRLKNIANWVEKTAIGEDDCLLFYFSGHGTGDRTGKSPWPIMCLKKNKEFLPLNLLEKVLESKKPRLLLILCDSCNNYVHLKKKGHRGAFVEKSAFDNSHSLKKLFKEAKGKIVASAAIPGSSSWGNQHGGLFTIAFLLCLKKESAKDHPSWKHLFKSIPLELIGSGQTPQYKLMLN